MFFNFTIKDKKRKRAYQNTKARFLHYFKTTKNHLQKWQRRALKGLCCYFWIAAKQQNNFIKIKIKPQRKNQILLPLRFQK